MVLGFLRRLAGGGARDETSAHAARSARLDPPPPGSGEADVLSVEGATKATADAGAEGVASGHGPVFSSRAVRDAALVTGAMVALNRFVSDADSGDELMNRLQALSLEQASFLQLSADAALLAKAIAKAEAMKTPRGAALRKALADLAGSDADKAGDGRIEASFTAPLFEAAGKRNPLNVGQGPVTPGPAFAPGASGVMGLTAPPPAHRQPAPEAHRQPAPERMPNRQGERRPSDFRPGPAASRQPSSVIPALPVGVLPPGMPKRDPAPSPKPQAELSLSSAPPVTAPPARLAEEVPPLAAPPPVTIALPPLASEPREDAAPPAQATPHQAAPPPEPSTPVALADPAAPPLPPSMPRLALTEAQNRRARLLAAFDDHFFSASESPS
jgi:hypothetical protein